MKHLSIAIAVVGVAASVAWCTAKDAETQYQSFRFKADLCVNQGGKWTRGWGTEYCDFRGGE